MQVHPRREELTMAKDPRADEFVRNNDIVGLFRYLGPMWIVVCMQILEDMLIRKIFYPNPDRYATELRSAGIYVDRMEIAMVAALHKVGRSITWEQFEDMHGRKMDQLPPQQKGEIKNFWLAPPTPGLVKDPKTAQEEDFWSEAGTWEFDFEPDLEVGSYRLPNGTVIPLPPRGKYWPKRVTTAKFGRSTNRFENVMYNVILRPKGKDSYWLQKFLLDQAAESLLSKAGAILIGGIIAPILAGAATVFVPNETGATFIWKTTCSEGGKQTPVYGITSGFNV
jgi:hypothetical protein